MLALEAVGITKRYGGLVALADGRLELAAGEVHALMGSNGCGKSTLCKIIAGAVGGDGGTVRMGGRDVTFRSPSDAKAAGIATVYQETSLVPTLSVAENIALGAEPVRWSRLIDRRARDRELRDLIARTGDFATGLDMTRPVGELTVDQRQIVEVLKALLREPRIILFDEATSSFDKAQVASFFALVRGLRARGCSIIFISHRIEEILAIADRVTIMRNGRTIASRLIAETGKDEIVRLMVGAELAVTVPTARAAGPPLLEARGLGGGQMRDCSFTLHAGEVLGLGGLHGQGQSDLLRVLFGALRRAKGQIVLGGRPIDLASPLAALREGLAYVSGDRGRAGALGQRSILENLALSHLSRERPWIVRRGPLGRRLLPVAARMKTKFAGLSQPLSGLSGGNQQKVILARALAAAPRILLLDDPTKGIDVEAKRDLFVLIGELRAMGAAVILYSSEDLELLDNADRVLVFNGGDVVEELAGERLTEFNLYSAALRAAA